MKTKRSLILGITALLSLTALTITLIHSFVLGGDVEASDNQPAPQMVIAIEEVINGERTAGEVAVTFAYPDDIPTGPTAAAGLFLASTDNSMALGTGSIEVEADIEQVDDAEPVETVNAVHDGPTVDVRFDANTQFFLDNTGRIRPTAAEIAAGSMLVTRTIVPGSAADLGANMMVRVWGTVAGDQVLADIVVYEPIQ